MNDIIGGFAVSIKRKSMKYSNYLASVCILSMSAFMGCSEESETVTTDPSTLNSCKCTSEECTNCSVSTKTCEGNKLVEQSGVVGQYNGKNVIHLDKSAVTCGSKTCVVKGENDAACESASGNDDSSDACQCENDECMNCATVVKEICTNGMSIGRIDRTYSINGVLNGSTFTSSKLIGEDCPKKCQQTSDTTAVCE